MPRFRAFATPATPSTSRSVDFMTSVTTRFAYDAVGNQTSVQDGLNHTTTTVYDERDRPIRQTRPAAAPPCWLMTPTPG